MAVAPIPIQELDEQIRSRYPAGHVSSFATGSETSSLTTSLMISETSPHGDCWSGCLAGPSPTVDGHTDDARHGGGAAVAWEQARADGAW